MTTRNSTAVLSFLLSTLIGASAMADFWLGPISEEQGDAGGWCYAAGWPVVQQAFCSGPFCDDNYILCGTPTMWDGTPILMLDGFVATPLTSEEHFSSDPYRSLCPTGYAVTGMSATGIRSDNVRVFCRRMDLPALPPTCAWNQTTPVPPFSEEVGYSSDVSPFWFTGFRASGSYSDNMHYYTLGYYCNQ